MRAPLTTGDGRSGVPPGASGAARDPYGELRGAAGPETSGGPSHHSLTSRERR